MSTRFPDYRPSTALRAAIAAYRAAKERRAAAAHEAANTPGQGQGGVSPTIGAAELEAESRKPTPGREDTDIGATAEASRRIFGASFANTDALTSGRKEKD